MQRGRVHAEPTFGREELAEELVAARIYPIGYCLLCGESFYSEDDCIPDTWYHACEANLRYWAKERVMP